CVSLLWIAQLPGSGRATVLWLFALVWATDSGAYLVGRWAGGPRPAPRWSPKKTWSGAPGGAGRAGPFRAPPRQNTGLFYAFTGILAQDGVVGRCAGGRSG